MKKIVLLLTVFLPFTVLAQRTFYGAPVDRSIATPLQKTFTRFELYELNVPEISRYVSSATKTELKLILGSYHYSLQLAFDPVISENYRLLVDGKQSYSAAKNITYEGSFEGGSARLTVTNDVIYGLFRDTGKEIYIEPLWYHVKGVAKNIMVVYDSRDVIPDNSKGCGVTETAERREEMSVQGRDPLGCYITEVAIASDHSMVTKYGSAAAVEVHNIGVMNNVQADYDDGQLGNIVNFTIVTQNISTAEPNDQTSPLYTGTNSSTILSSFRAWGNAGNFGVTYDMAQLWTNRNIDDDGAGGSSSIVGLAYVGVVCGTSRYHLLEDYAGINASGNGYQLRVLTSHEMGHNFSANHDASGSGFIMAPSINNTTTWSAASITSISNHLATRTCLATCIPPGDCGNVSMLTYSGITTTSATLSWASLPGSTSYDVEYKSSSSSAWLSAASGTTSTSVTLNSLVQGTLYDWRVRPYCSNGQGEFSSSRFATSSVVVSCKFCEGSIVDIDGNSYSPVIIGTQVWLRENLKTTRYRNGDLINHISNTTQWVSSLSGAYSFYNNDSGNLSKYGNLYNWHAVNDSRGICPVGWHIPTSNDWSILINFLGGGIYSGGKMKSTSLLWDSPNIGANNSSGFSGLPGGYRNYDGLFSNIGNLGIFWEKKLGLNGGMMIKSNSAELLGHYTTSKNEGISCRCIKD